MLYILDQNDLKNQSPPVSGQKTRNLKKDYFEKTT